MEAADAVLIAAAQLPPEPPTEQHPWDYSTAYMPSRARQHVPAAVQTPPEPLVILVCPRPSVVPHRAGVARAWTVWRYGLIDDSAALPLIQRRLGSGRGVSVSRGR